MMTGLNLSEKVFKENITRLEAGFRLKQPLSAESVKVYYGKLCKFKDDVFSDAVELILDEDDFFPSIARFRRAKKDLPPKQFRQKQKGVDV